jgi:hypothetical protein
MALFPERIADTNSSAEYFFRLFRPDFVRTSGFMLGGWGIPSCTNKALLYSFFLSINSEIIAKITKGCQIIT